MRDPVVHLGPATAEYMRKHGLWSTPRVFRGAAARLVGGSISPVLDAQLRDCARYPGRPRGSRMGAPEDWPPLEDETAGAS